MALFDRFVHLFFLVQLVADPRALSYFADLTHDAQLFLTVLSNLCP